METFLGLPVFGRTSEKRVCVPERVWYAAYGSNVLEARLQCYIKGDAPTPAHARHAGCRDMSDPVKSQMAVLEHGLLFAEHSEPWQGGVAFLDPEPESGMTFVRLWNLAREQFEDIAAMENSLRPGAVHIGWQDLWEDGAWEMDGGGWYGLVVSYGDYEGDPVLGFTCPDAMKTWQEPGAPYRETILNGLVEGGLDVEVAQRYGQTWSADFGKGG